MDMNWLYGPRTVRAYDNRTDFGSFVINHSDLKDLREAFEHAGYDEVQVLREGTSHMAGIPTYSTESGDLIDFTKPVQSDADLRAIRITCWSTDKQQGPSLVLGHGVLANLTIPVEPAGTAEDAKNQELEKRVIEIITRSGRRRIPPNMRKNAGILLGWLALACVWIYTVATTWFSLGALVLGGAAALAAAELWDRTWQRNYRSAQLFNRDTTRCSNIPPAVAIDPYDRVMLRASRWNTKRDVKVSIVMLVIGTVFGYAFNALTALITS